LRLSEFRNWKARQRGCAIGRQALARVTGLLEGGEQ